MAPTNAQLVETVEHQWEITQLQFTYRKIQYQPLIIIKPPSPSFVVIFFLLHYYNLNVFLRDYFYLTLYGFIFHIFQISILNFRTKIYLSENF